MLDTIDSPLYLAWNQPEQYGDLYQATVELVKAIRTKYPDIILMVNRGFEVGSKRSILPDIAREIDFVLAESTLTQVDKPSFYSPEMQQNTQQILAAAKAANPNLHILSLDYWDIQDVQSVKKIYQTQRQNGYIPLVSLPALDMLSAEPQ
jgi:hypothetical protein